MDVVELVSVLGGGVVDGGVYVDVGLVGEVGEDGDDEYGIGGGGVILATPPAEAQPVIKTAIETAIAVLICEGILPLLNIEPIKYISSIS